MQPHPPQLPRDDAQRPKPKNLKKGALWFLVLLLLAAALVAFLLPKKQVEGRTGLPASQTDSPAYRHPKQ